MIKSNKLKGMAFGIIFSGILGNSYMSHLTNVKKMNDIKQHINELEKSNQTPTSQLK